jgi:hypothetical protein
LQAWAQLLGGGGLFVFAVGVLVFVATRKRDKNTDSQERFTANIELNKYIDGVVAAALAPLLTEIASLKTAMATVNARELTTKNILRRFFQRLLWWDERGRDGDMPMPSAADMATLDLADIEHDNTMSREDVAAIRAQTKE